MAPGDDAGNVASCFVDSHAVVSIARHGYHRVAYLIASGTVAGHERTPDFARQGGAQPKLPRMDPVLLMVDRACRWSFRTVSLACLRDQARLARIHGSRQLLRYTAPRGRHSGVPLHLQLRRYPPPPK